MVGMDLKSICLLLATAVIGLVSCTSINPDGFLSVDCGANDNQTDQNGLLWVSDAPFIKTREVSKGPFAQLFQLRTFAFFKNLEAKKYCYSLPVQLSLNYLVRATFYPDSTSYLATIFDLSIEGINWDTVNLSSLEIHYYGTYEIILAAKSESLSLCLARNSQTEENRYVFITSIELRPLNSSMYNSTDFVNKALYLYDRISFGANNSIHYPDDPFDRYWLNLSSITDKRTVAVAAEVDQTESLGSRLMNKPPTSVLRTAIAKTVVDNMTISGAFQYISLPGFYFFAVYFCNINQAKVTGKFAVYIDHYQISEFQELGFLQCKQVNRVLELPTPGYVNITFKPSDTSQLGPFINAAEMYSVLQVQTTTNPGDVFAIRKIAEAINVPDDWTGGDPCLPANYSSTGITCSQDDPPRVIIINLTNMNLDGVIPTNIGDLTALIQLLLGNNNLSGQIPDLSSLKNLTILQLQNNQLTGEIPRSLEKLQMLRQLFLQGNKLEGTVSQGLVRPGLDLRFYPQNNLTSPSHKIKAWVIVVLIVCALVLVLVVFSAIFLWRLKRQSQPAEGSVLYQQHPSTDEDNQNHYHRLAIEYTEEEIKIATNNYSKLIGKGGFGSVYYGRVSGCDVAVKIHENDSNQGKGEFQNEVTLLSRIYHKNLVNLIGYCKQSIMALVYEYMHCGTLKDHLHGKLEKPLDWHTRLSIALQAAEGLLYLHNGCSPPIIHRDIKSSNILLDNKMCAKVADFGLSKLVASSKGYTLTEVKGTMGYLDPEYFATLSLNEKTDVYSFGVVLLEIISGVSPKQGIVESARKLLSCGNIENLVDSSLGGRYNVESAWKVAEVACTCVENELNKRPKMNVVVKELEEAVALAHANNNLSVKDTMASFDNRDLPSLR
ncbi:hypothetical protein SUGI_0372170 [Cryptomeria japonica]|uniref:probable LRR receptor-like serine/threonine-protein kinase At1g67720 n=1 Tax=Cryptomeria japonica TaxID=3369 RepID=UPI002408D53F|nr:probable LRR receptor-like serine/threonine-protein kinase At1g67720 [Cryptomeria japonica]GLJ20457.1 hypothetical protein SUGI_0372170 [Cryptomeria japonica]